MLYLTSQITLLQQLVQLEELVLLQPSLEQLALRLLLVQELLRHKRHLHIRWCCRKSCNHCRMSCYRMMNRSCCRRMMHIRSLELVHMMSS